MPYIDVHAKKNFKGFTKTQVEKAILARDTQAMMVHPSDNQFEQVVSTKSLDNCNVKLEDISNACTILAQIDPALGAKPQGCCLSE